MSLNHLTQAGNQGNLYQKPIQVSSLVVGGLGALSTTTTGVTNLIYLPTCAGAPSGAPGTPGSATGVAPLIIDSTDTKLYCYVGGAWKSVTFA